MAIISYTLGEDIPRAGRGQPGAGGCPGDGGRGERGGAAGGRGPGRAGEAGAGELRPGAGPRDTIAVAATCGDNWPRVDTELGRGGGEEKKVSAKETLKESYRDQLKETFSQKCD